MTVAAALVVLGGVLAWSWGAGPPGRTRVPEVPPSAPAPHLLGDGTWLAREFFDEAAVAQRGALPYLRFRGDSTFAGGDPCNPVIGTYRLVGERLTLLREDVLTPGACGIEQQRLFLQALDATRGVRRTGATLELLDDTGAALARWGESLLLPSPPARAPDPTSADGVLVRIQNTSDADFAHVLAVFSDGQRVDFGPLRHRTSSGYVEVERAYRDAVLEVVAVGGNNYQLRPSRDRGPRLEPGRYSYAVSLDGPTLRVALVVD